jgi:hypothetical protein
MACGVLLAHVWKLYRVQKYVDRGRISIKWAGMPRVCSGHVLGDVQLSSLTVLLPFCSQVKLGQLDITDNMDHVKTLGAAPSHCALWGLHIYVCVCLYACSPRINSRPLL